MKMAEIIKKLRLQKGITQEELGKVIGVQKSAIRKYESGAVENIKRDSIKKMAKYFGVTPSYLMGLDNSSNNYGVNNGIIGNNNSNNHISHKYKLSPIDEAILTICTSLSEKEKTKVLAFVTKLLSQSKK